MSASRLHMHAWVCSMCGCVFPLHTRNITLSVSKNESLTLPKRAEDLPLVSRPASVCVRVCVCYSGSAISLECSVRCQREKSLQWHAHITLQKHQDDLKRPESEETGPVLLCVSFGRPSCFCSTYSVHSLVSTCGTYMTSRSNTYSYDAQVFACEIW